MTHPAEKPVLALIVLLFVTACSSGDSVEAATTNEGSTMLTPESASRFASLALDCMHREYPNKLGQVLKDESGLLPPKTLHPAFYGCFDWHSSVHGHWMLIKILKKIPDLPERDAVVSGLSQSLTAEPILGPPQRVGSGHMAGPGCCSSQPSYTPGMTHSADSGPAVSSHWRRLSVSVTSSFCRARSIRCAQACIRTRHLGCLSRVP